MRLNDDIVPRLRRLILNLLTNYRELETPANPEILKLHIDSATDAIKQLIATAERAARIDELNKLREAAVSQTVETFTYRHYLKRLAELSGEETTDNG